ncbi:MAG: serine/threonine-protein kinase [Gemmataceae bacterium]
MAETDPADFFLVAVRSGLVTAEDLAAVPRADSRAAADLLVAAEKLTHFQAEKLLHGRWQGFFIGPYVILAPVGRGGMGAVYLARRRDRTGGLLALKVLSPKRAKAETRTLARFLREMQLGRHLEHPNVTRTFEAGEDDGTYFIAMEYVPGLTLRQLVEAGGPLSVPDAARVFADVAAGLAHAHARGLIHRDLKPANVMVTPEGRAKLLDLGLAIMVGERQLDDSKILGTKGYVLGTMDYIAPEQTTDPTAVGPAADLYALGCSLYFALAGLPPFPGGTSKQKIQWQRAEEPPPLAQFNPAVPAPLVALVRSLMAKNPADRPPSADAVRAVLTPWAGDAFSRPSGDPGEHSTRETVAALDAPGSDPELWDAEPIPDVAVGAPELKPWVLVAAGCGVLAILVGLVVVVGLVSRL